MSAARTRPQRWTSDARDPARLIHKTECGDALLMIAGDVTNLAVEGVVSNDDVDGRMYTVIASSIKAAAGLDVERESISGGPYPQGQAWYTDSGSLPPPFKGIVHVAAMDRRGRSDIDTISMCVGSALVEARHQRLNSLAIAAFGTGPRGSGPRLVTLDEWLIRVGKTILSDFAKPAASDDEQPIAVLLVLYEQESFDAVAAALKRALDGSVG